MNYWYYGLKKTKYTLRSRYTRDFRTFLKRLYISLKDSKFYSKDPILVLDFLTMLVEECDIPGMN